MLLRRGVVVVAVFASALLVGSRLVQADGSMGSDRGALTQLNGENGCVNADGAEGCAVGRVLNGAGEVAVSPDGKNVYATSVGDEVARGGVAVFARNRKNGALTQLDGEDGCVAEAIFGFEDCADGRALFAPDSVTVSPDGKNVYVTDTAISGTAVFARDRKTGALTQLDGEDGCVNSDGAEGCAVGRGGGNDITVSPDGKSVYFASGDAVAVFARDRRTGALTKLDGEDGCVNSDGRDGCAVGRAVEGTVTVAVSRDGKSVYVASASSEGGVAVFARDRRTGALAQLDGEHGCVNFDGVEGCAVGRAVDIPMGVTVSPDGRGVYVASFLSDAVAVFARDRRTGALTQLDGEGGCVNADGAEGCAVGRALDGAGSVAVSRDGKSVYVGGGVAVFARDRRTGALTQLDGEDGCVNNDGAEGCADARAFEGGGEVAVSPDGKSVYAAASGSDAVAVFARDRGPRHHLR
jgi:DNA-binding beta-propeller fold protein YncE